MDYYKIKSDLEQNIKDHEEANLAYRIGMPIMSDAQYDDLEDEIKELQNKLSEINPGDDSLDYDTSSVGIVVSDDDDRKGKLPIPMASMEKVKTYEEILSWVNGLNLPKVSLFVLSPKYDGAALCVDEEFDKAWTRGDGKEGQRSHEHFKMVGEAFSKPVGIYTFGELIIPRKAFEDNYSYDAFERRVEEGDDVDYIFGNNAGFANGRNLISGKLNDKTPHEDILPKANYMRFGMQYKGESTPITKQDQLTRLNKMNAVDVPFRVVTAEEMTEELLTDLFYEWSEGYELDGVIIDVDDPLEVQRIGRNRVGNPEYARAYKNPDFAEKKTTKVVNVEWKLSKQGLLKPRVEIVPVVLNGATVTYVTGNNARFIVNMGIAVGEEVEVVRSGMVIPKIVSVGGVKVPEANDKTAIKEAAEQRSHVDVNLPTHCYSCGEDYGWTEGKVDLICENADCPEQQIERVIAFFDVLAVDNMGEGNVKAFFEAGYDTVAKILDMSIEDMSEVDRFGKKKASLIHRSIKAGVNDVYLEKLQHSTGYFKGLGSKKLALVEGMENSSIDEIAQVQGFAKKSAKAYLDGYPKYLEFVKDLPVTIAEKAQPTSDKFKDENVVFSGIRNKDWEIYVVDGGGAVKSGVSKNTTLLVMKETGTGSSKEVKAQGLGVKIINGEEFEALLNG